MGIPRLVGRVLVKVFVRVDTGKGRRGKPDVAHAVDSRVANRGHIDRPPVDFHGLRPLNSRSRTYDILLRCVLPFEHIERILAFCLLQLLTFYYYSK